MKTSKYLSHKSKRHISQQGPRTYEPQLVFLGYPGIMAEGPGPGILI